MEKPNTKSSSGKDIRNLLVTKHTIYARIIKNASQEYTILTRSIEGTDNAVLSVLAHKSKKSFMSYIYV